MTVKRVGSGSRLPIGTRVPTLAVSLTGPVTYSKLLYLSVLRFRLYKKDEGDNDSIYLIGYCVI